MNNSFVNRKDELKIVNEVFDVLKDDRRLVRNPVMEFCGIDGIGKTAFLKQLRNLCYQKEIPCILEDMRGNTALAASTRTLLAAQTPAVILLDSLDAASAEQLREIEEILEDLIENDGICIVLASRSMQGFDNARSIARKLKVYSLQPLRREDCQEYLGNVANIVALDVRDTICDWTRGYPLAMNVMTEAIIQQHLDPIKENDRKILVRILSERVIEQNLLANVSSAEARMRYQILLGLLAFPRRFNLILMQDMIERFAPQYQLESSLAYIALPPDIKMATSVLTWDLQRTGYCIEAPIRRLLQLQWSIEEPESYLELHRFLAEKNEQFAQRVALGADHIRYLRETFYHLAQCCDESRLREKAVTSIEQLAREEALDSFLQLYEEFSQDEELQETLGSGNTNFILSVMRKNFTRVYTSIAGKTKSRYLREFFLRTAHDPKIEDFALIFEGGMRQIIRQESPGDAIKLYNEMAQDEELRALLGQDFDRVLTSVFNDLLNEG